MKKKLYLTPELLANGVFNAEFYIAFKRTGQLNNPQKRVTFKGPLRSDGVDLEFICRRKPHDLGRVLALLRLHKEEYLISLLYGDYILI
ncbi:hypothetical protein BDB01DRAFT_848360 [Pilobolus umbonatus]|nr:hypothetical protein BDB01DRAFT_848360 [Pilobolus umbonatus]